MGVVTKYIASLLLIQIYLRKTWVSEKQRRDKGKHLFFKDCYETFHKSKEKTGNQLSIVFQRSRKTLEYILYSVVSINNSLHAFYTNK